MLRYIVFCCLVAGLVTAASSVATGATVTRVYTVTVSNKMVNGSAWPGTPINVVFNMTVTFDDGVTGSYTQPTPDGGLNASVRFGPPTLLGIPFDLLPLPFWLSPTTTSSSSWKEYWPSSRFGWSFSTFRGDANSWTSDGYCYSHVELSRTHVGIPASLSDVQTPTLDFLLNQMSLGGEFQLRGTCGNSSVWYTGGFVASSSPVDFAKSLLNAPYLLGAKGWDWQSRATGGQRYVEATEIKSLPGYHWNFKNLGEIAPAVDCSGLTLWSYNKAAGETRYPPDNEQISYVSADGQFQNATDHFTDDAQLREGDLVFFDYEVDRPYPLPFGTAGTIDHVAMYIGDGKLIEATPDAGVHETSLSERKALLRNNNECCAFVGYGRVRASAIGFAAKSQSPIHLAVRDPEGYSIAYDTVLYTNEERLTEVPGHLYYSVAGDGHDTVYSPVLKQGAYVISVSPKEGAAASDQYSLRVEAAGQTLVLADRVNVGNAPRDGYGVYVRDQNVEQFLPLTVVARPDSSEPVVNRRSNGVLPVAVLSSPTFDATALDAVSLRLGQGGAAEAHLQVHAEDVNGDGLPDAVLHFRIQDLALSATDTSILMLGTMADGRKVRGTAAVSVIR